MTQAAAQNANQCPFKVSSDPAPVNAARDGMLLVRYAQGARGAALVMGTNADAGAVQTAIEANASRLDVNGNGRFDTDDALVIARVISGYAGEARINAAKDADRGATRSTVRAINEYVDGGCAATFASVRTFLQSAVGVGGSARADNARAIRFLTRATFGATLADAQALNAAPGPNFEAKAAAWVDAQLAMTAAPQSYDYVVKRARTLSNVNYAEVRDAFYQQAMSAPDQLRQRLAFALSEIMVVSVRGSFTQDPYVLSGYHDMLASHALGNFRDLLYGVVRSPAMADYLNHLQNDGNTAKPNENFARELLQLFSVGVLKLNLDGTPQSGNVETYSEETVKGFANAFTGLSYDDRRTPAQRCTVDVSFETLPNWNWFPSKRCPPPDPVNLSTDLDASRRPLRMYDGYFSNREKKLLSYTASELMSADPRCSAANIDANRVLPAIAAQAGITNGTRVSAATGNAMLERAVDNIFCHPNVAPFVSKSLIRFLTTSTPSSAYVARVAAKFNDNGAGVRGDMKAVARAILLDPEAISAESTLSASELRKFGKLKEPLLRLLQVMRAFGAYSESGKYRLHHYLWVPEDGVGQDLFHSPSVFNFFHAQFAPPGPVGDAGATAPEFEMTTSTTIAATANYLGRTVVRNAFAPRDRYRQHAQFNIGIEGCDAFASTPVTADCIRFDYKDLYAIANDAPLLIDYLDVVLMGGSLAPGARSAYAAAIDAAFPATSGACVLPAAPTINDIDAFDDCRSNRVMAAAWLAMHSPEFQIQQ